MRNGEGREKWDISRKEEKGNDNEKKNGTKNGKIQNLKFKVDCCSKKKQDSGNKKERSLQSDYCCYCSAWLLSKTNFDFVVVDIVRRNCCLSLKQLHSKEKEKRAKKPFQFPCLP